MRATDGADAKKAQSDAMAPLIVQGVANQTWVLKNDQDWYDPTMQRYLQEDRKYAQDMEDANTAYDPQKIDRSGVSTH
ncbi:hypothetical protein [Burkholderia contaminans]|uniref:hypothetical protein n=1 Tax=Burkholderia contaminans TaxID=488447 RepID=UPI00162781EB|nr:hypothetical protein [Burkholderia contaminans]